MLISILLIKIYNEKSKSRFKRWRDIFRNKFFTVILNESASEIKSIIDLSMWIYYLNKRTVF